MSAGAGILAALHVLPGSRRLDPLSAPLSQYAFTPNGWLFDTAVSMLALGLAVLVSALVRGGCVAGRSSARALLTACSLGLVLVAVFPEHERNGAVGAVGRIHWAAAMLAFGGVSFAPVLLRHHGAAVCSRVTSLARRLSAYTTPCFLVVLAASLLKFEAQLPVPGWWFGVGERVLVAAELVLAALLTVWAWRGCTCGAAEGHLSARGSRTTAWGRSAA